MILTRKKLAIISGTVLVISAGAVTTGTILYRRRRQRSGTVAYPFRGIPESRHRSRRFQFDGRVTTPVPQNEEEPFGV